MSHFRLCSIFTTDHLETNTNNTTWYSTSRKGKDMFALNFNHALNFYTKMACLIVMFRSCNFRSSGGLGPLPFGPWTVRSFLHRSSGFFRSFLGTINHWKSDAQGIILSNLKNHAFFLSTIFACTCTAPLSLIIRWSSECGQNKFWSQR